jgi:hypothetical protein
MPREPGGGHEDLPDDMKEFIDSIQRGEKPGMDDAQLEQFKGRLKKEYETGRVGVTTNIGPAGKMERA